jgi:alpha-mannosidase
MRRIFAVFLCSALFAAGNVLAQEPAAPNPRQTLLDRLLSCVTQSLDTWKFHADVPHPEDAGLDDKDWPMMKTGEGWKTGPRVLRKEIQVPQTLNGYDLRGARVRLALKVDSDDFVTITVFSNGSMVSRTDSDTLQPIVLTETAQPGEKFLIAIRIQAAETNTVLYSSELLISPPATRPDPGIFREEILAAQPMVATFPEGKPEHEGILDAAAKTVDLAALDHGDQAAFDASLRQAQAKLDALRPWLQQYTIRAVGNSHIDMAWLWPWTETVEVVRNTFRSVLDLMREYPDFQFTMSSARTYAWMEEKYPELFKEIQQRVKEGRWEIVGGMWVEPDLNMPGGESLVRQILVGKRYFQQKFGVDVKIGWNPDSFGYNWQLPQIYKKSGMDTFVTQKLMWAHEFTVFPYKMFYWEAPDGSRLLTYFPHDYAMGIEPVQLGKDASVWLPAIYGPNPPPKSEMMHLYGVGDHGGGPTRTMLDDATRWMKPDVVFPNLQFSVANAFFANLQPKLPNMNVPVWHNELYFEYHRGVFTTQAETKKRIRTTEELLLNAEKFSAFATLFGRPYPSSDFDRGWKDLLFDDFHDIFPGSGIAVNYLDAKRNLEDVQRVGRDILNGSLDEIASNIQIKGTGVPVVVFNSLSWERNELLETQVRLPGATRFVEVHDASGKAVPSQVLSADRETRVVHLLLKVNVPAMGYATYYVAPRDKAATTTAEVEASGDTLENEFIRLKVDAKSGCMTSLFDKRTNMETLAPAETDTGGPKDSICGNLLQTFVDKPKQWDAWNIDADFEKEHWDLTQADEVKLVESGPLRAVLRVKNHFQYSTFVRDIVVTAGSPRADVKMTADWHEKHILLKVAMPVSVHSNVATFEIPYGSIGRPTTRNTRAEQGMFEVPALHWADLSDEKHGLSLLNDCKYGYDAKGNVLRLSLLRSPVWPDPHADEGMHEFTYSLYPHTGNWKDALTIRRGYELNYPLLARQEEAHSGHLPETHSFLQLPAENVVFTAAKKAEDGDALVLRFYEWAGKESDVTLRTVAGVADASETDLMERPISSLPIQDGVITIHTKPYEIKTLKVQLRETSPANSQESMKP